MKNYFLLLFIVAGSFTYSHAQQRGCSDPLALNYNSTATINDGSCTYQASSVSTNKSEDLPSYLSETSGLMYFNNKLWTQNDDSDIKIYEIDPNNTKDIKSREMTGVKNFDWEDLTQDKDFVYIGDFGNNTSGNRRDLNILRVDKRSLLSGRPKIDTIKYIYSNQFDYSPTGFNNTDFDCESFIAVGDSLYLFTKEWISQKTAVYSLSNKPGSRVAKLQTSYDIDGLVTGAYFDEVKKAVVLCGYSNILEPFVFLLYDYQGNSFFSGNKRKISLNLLFHQIEGITSKDGKTFYMTNEKFSKSFINIPQRLHTIDLSPFLSSINTNYILMQSTV